MINRRSVLIANAIKGGGIPSEYQQVEYIESVVDAGSYIDIGKNFGSCSVVVDYQLITQRGVHFGANSSRGEDFISSGRSNSIVYLNGTYSKITETLFDRTLFEFNSTNGNAFLRINDETKLTSNQNAYGKPIFIFAGINLTSSYIPDSFSDIKCWSWKTYENGNLVQNLVPCYRKSDNVIGMYDLCGTICLLTNAPFYVNSGSGTFLKGADVNA